MSEHFHFAKQGNNIVCWNGNDGWTIIANIVLERPCEQLIRNSQFAEEVENAIGKCLYDTTGKKVSCYEVEEL